jgi:hypothetical protein
MFHSGYRDGLPRLRHHLRRLPRLIRRCKHRAQESNYITFIELSSITKVFVALVGNVNYILIAIGPC